MASIGITIGGRLYRQLNSEDELLGSVCCYLSIYEANSQISDIEVSSNVKFVLLPNNLTSFKKSLTELQAIHDKLQVVDTERTKVLPISSLVKRQKYYINPDDIDFTSGYYGLLRMIAAFQKMEDINYTEYEDEFSADTDFMSKCELISTPVSPNTSNSFRFTMKSPAYLWILPNVKVEYTEQLISNLINLYLQHCTSEERDLLKEDRYLRFMIYQDNPYSVSYVYGYLRPIAECTYQSHKDILRSCPVGYLPCEITTRIGYFCIFPQTEWNNNKVNHVRMVN